MRVEVPPGRTEERGFALILALLSLLVLTFLGLTLAVTTSSELQIAQNYRWSQQALYNAEAGIEAGKVMLRDANGTDWQTILPSVRASKWLWNGTGSQAGTAQTLPGAAPSMAVGANLRHWENGQCDAWGGAVGYGIILNDVGDGHGPVQYLTNVFGQQLNGAFTLWVRRKTDQSGTTGELSDSADNSSLVLTSEGIAPYVATVDGAGNTLNNFARANMSIKVLEVHVVRKTEACTNYAPQAGQGPAGMGYNSCVTLGGTGGNFAAALSDLGNASRTANVGSEGGSGGAGGMGQQF
jgi:hypothetical protein